MWSEQEMPRGGMNNTWLTSLVYDAQSFDDEEEERHVQEA